VKLYISQFSLASFGKLGIIFKPIFDCVRCQLLIVSCITMSQVGETFFTVVGCMDGRVQDVMARLGQEKFGAKYPDTITEAGIVGLIANPPADGSKIEFVENLKFKLLVSIDKHHSKGILVDGHQECAGNPVSDDQHKEDIKKSVEFISKLIENKVPVVGVFVVRDGDSWTAQEI
jgi:carbonic anhydrase